MLYVVNSLGVVIAILHIGFLVLEMFYWDHPRGRKIFHTTPEFSRASAVLAANQGLYNGFLAAGLIWGLVSGQVNIIVFFLICVLVAGLYGGFTAGRRILYIQALPAVIALLAVYLSK
jgi:putative membrane protein